jgi:tetratricopeptide (TPR) repeat protein
VKQLDLPAAEAEFATALRLDPGSAAAHHWHGLGLAAAGRLDEALAEMRTSATLEPLSATITNSLMILLFETRQFPAAERQARRVLELDSTFSTTYNWMGLTQLFLGRADSAVQLADKGRRLSSRIGGRARLMLAYAGAGRWADADRLRAVIDRPGDPKTSDYDRAISAMLYQDLDKAAAALERSLINGELFGVVYSPGCDPQLDPLKNQPRFTALMRRYGMRVCPATTPWPIKPRP